MEKRTFIITMTLTSIFLIFGLIILCLMNTLIHDLIVRQTRLVPDTELYNQWLKPPNPVCIEFYFFNLTNPTEFKAGQKPKVVQLGPYTYWEKRFKIQVVQNTTLGTVAYREVIRYHFDSNKSTGLESDLITSTNLAYLQIASSTNWLPLPIDRIVEIVEHTLHEYLIVQHTVGELLWGYEDKLLKFLQDLMIPVPTTQIGLFVGKNNSQSPDWLIQTGFPDPMTLGQIVQYANQSSMSCWTSQTANMINGSDGSLFHPFLNLSDQPYVFSPDMCRSVQLYGHSQSSINGVPMLTFLPMDDTFKSGLNVEKNRGFCLNWPDCLGDGVLDMSTCMPKAPIVISLPHFLYANETYQNAVDGLHPTEELNTTFHIEPQTGIVLKLAKKYQINSIVKQNPKFQELQNLTSLFLPIVFVNETYQIDSESLGQLRNLLIQGPIITKVILSLFVIVLLIGACVLIGTFVYRRQEQADYEPILASTPDP